MSSGPRLNVWTAVAPLPATAVGLVVAMEHGVRWTAYAPNFAAIVAGVLLAAAARRGSRASLAAWLPGAAALLILLTLVGPAIEGVHRWLPLGGFRLNASAAFAPWLLLAFCAPEAETRAWAVTPAVFAQLGHLAQPDAGQATALAAGLLPFALAGGHVKRRLGVPLAVVACGLAAGTWLKPDPLPAVDHVERILGLAWSNGGAWPAATALAGVALLLPIVRPLRRHAGDARVLAVALYFIATFAVTFIGNFPVPIFGAGAGPVLGWYALLATADRAPPTPAGEPPGPE